jgi:hypothetical protein
MEKIGIIALVMIVSIVTASVGVTGVFLTAQGTTIHYASIVAVFAGIIAYVYSLYYVISKRAVLIKKPSDKSP